ncbi:MAG: hypothetical protein LWX55_01565 [Deltaproteobacteria bacterium]|jgi:hypothetical protein|nr:hypothetical protein [Deltaproteobacteria bacterium]
MKRVYELDVYKLAEALSDMVWHDFDKKRGRNNLPKQAHRSESILFDLTSQKLME